MMNQEYNNPYEDPFYAQSSAPVSPASAPEKKKKNRTGLKIAALALSCSLLGGVVGSALTGGRTAASDTATLSESSRAPATVNVAYVSGGAEMTAAEVYAANVNATVGITTSITTNYFGYHTSAAAAGSGFIVTENGYIVTNYHVVEDGSDIKVTTYNGDTYDAVLVGYDESNDLAVLKIEASGLQTVVLGSSDTLNVGDDVLAIGNPLGELTFSLTKGAVSALDREITLSSGVTMNLIQTDAAINSGNSGGALFNLYGEVVGITNAKYSSSSSSSEASVDNIGFAIPISSVEPIIKSIIEKGYFAKPYIGVYLTDGDTGVTVHSVIESSPAAEAGLAAGDLITEANGTAIKEASELTALVGGMNPGDALTLTVIRDGEETSFTLTVGEKRQSAQTENETAPEQQQSSDSWFYGFPFGFSGQPNHG